MEWTETEIEDLKILISRVGSVPSAKEAQQSTVHNSIIVTKYNISPVGRGGISPLHVSVAGQVQSSHILR